jgi:hypothetical protein
MHLQALPERESAWNGLDSLLLHRDLNFDDFDGVLAGMMSAAPWLEHSIQVNAVDGLLGSVERAKSEQNLILDQTVLALAHAIPNLSPRLRAQAFNVALESIRADENGVSLQRIKFETLSGLASSAGSLPGLASRNAVDALLEVIPSLVSHNDRKEVLIELARKALPGVLKQQAPIAERLWRRTRSHPSRELLLESFIDKVSKLRATVRMAALEQMISDAGHPASMGTRLKPALKALLDTTRTEILDRRNRRESQVA